MKYNYVVMYGCYENHLYIPVIQTSQNFCQKKNQKLNEDIELEARPTEKQWLNWEKQNKKGV